jgi:hypothetical protein
MKEEYLFEVGNDQPVAAVVEYNSCKSLIFKHQEQARQAEVDTETDQLVIPVDINKVIQLDSQVINFGKFVSGKILGSTL